MAEVGGNRPTSGPWWRPDRFALRHDKLMARSRILATVRDFFAENGFVEVETPVLQVSPGLEPHLRAFGVVPHVPFEGKAQPRFLHTSPEFAMKKLLAAGLPWPGATADANQPFERLSVADAFKRHCGIDLLATAPDPGRPDAARLAAAAESVGIAPHPGDDWEALFFRIFLDRIEPHLGISAPTLLYDYPVSLAALSRPKPGDPRLCERFELYVCGLELANAFGELTDAQEQRRRFLADQAKKQTLYGETYPIDEDFLAALEHGLPDCAGIALGFDRLVMLLTGAAHIEEVLWAPVAPPD